MIKNESDFIADFFIKAILNDRLINLIMIVQMTTIDCNRPYQLL